MQILGISAFYHDSAAALVRDGEIIAAAQEERFTRKKHDSRFPAHAVEYCLAQAGARLSDLDYVVFYDKPFLKFERLLETYIAFAPSGLRSFQMAIPLWVREKLFQKSLLHDELKRLGEDFDWMNRLLFTEHHQSHAASAFYPSPFEEALVLTMDGVGEWATTSVALGRGNHLEIIKEIHFPHSLGLLYSAFTYYTGFKVNSGEYKLMGLAPYGEASLRSEDPGSSGRYQTRRFLPLEPGVLQLLHRPDHDQRQIRRIVRGTAAQARRVADPAPHGSCRIDPRRTGRSGFADDALARQRDWREKSVSGRRRCAELRGQREAAARRQLRPNLDSAGRRGRRRRVGSRSGRSTTRSQGQPRQVNGCGDRMHGSYLGPEFSQARDRAAPDQAGRKYSCPRRSRIFLKNAWMRWSTRRPSAGSKAAWSSGPEPWERAQFLGDPQSPRMQSMLNLKVKFRESFRPFAPSVLREHVAEWFEMDCDSPYMLLVADVVESRRKPMTAEQQKLFGIEKLNVPRSDIPAVTHVDYSARIQTVHRRNQPAIPRVARAV